MHVKALIAGYEVMFAGPHMDTTLSPADIASLSSVFDEEGHDVGPRRLSYLLDERMGARAARIRETGMETPLDVLLENMLDDLEIDAPYLVPRLVDSVASRRMERFRAVDGCVEFISSLRESKVAVGMVCNAPIGIPPDHIRELIERCGLGGLLDDMQFSSENGVVRPHARPYRYLISNMDISPGETSVLTGIPGEMEVLRKLGFENIFFPELGELPNPDGAVTIHELAEVSKFL